MRLLPLLVLQIRLVEHMAGLPVQPIVIPYMISGAGGTGKDADGSGADRKPASATNSHP